MIEQKKIIFSGLDYVGKTSIINSIQSKYSGLDSKPTLGINRTLMQYTKLLGFSISSWDLGGQSKFRRDYMKNKYRVFSDTKFFFYVVDSQDQDRLGDMLKYLDDILKTFVALKENPKIAILFHKADPDIKKDPEMVEYFENLQMQINFITKDHGFKPPQYFLTTIYDKSTLFFAFSRIVIDGSPKSVLTP